MAEPVFLSLVYENASGVRTVLSDSAVSENWELRGRKGFTAPEVDIITQRYASGVTKILKRITEPRTVSVNMVIVGDNREDRDELFFEMIGKLMDITNGEVGRLYAMRSDGTEVYLNCAYSSGLSIVEEYKKFHRFTLDFYAADPYFYRDLEDVTILLPPEAKITLRDGLYLGQGHVLGETTGQGEGVIVNHSSEALQPVIKVGSVSGQFEITNLTTGDRLHLINVNTGRNGVLWIDTREATKSIYIEYSDGTRVSAGQCLDWSNIDLQFPIVSGENRIIFEAGVGSYTEGVVFSMSERYLSA